MRLRHLFGLCFAIITGCSRTASTELLDANFIGKGQTAVDLISPTQNQQVASSTPSFSWSARGAGLYTLELATDSEFTNKVLEKEVKLVTEVTIAEGGYNIRLQSPALLKNVCLSLDTEGSFSNNFFDVVPNQTYNVFLKTNVASLLEVYKALKIKSLVETY